MESNFSKASSENLPPVNYVMIHEFFSRNTNYLSVEMKGMKNMKAARSGYGDDAVGYVQLKRENSICLIKGRIVPEHKVRSKPYFVEATIDESTDEIKNCVCESCVASQGMFQHLKYHFGAKVN
ncbi:uncharacterized protein LOC123317422 [Coccinella septempunctata]|uniref:uncharacterized protein LOC123317422 n=1 Tax=Coccinella septempunctata TaxID=41139 RepID=UPI001D060793|nr:uncharacterized protein LOC123317422 [Coccinella septempunctata]